MNNNIKILIADDHKIVIDGLRAILANEPNIEIAGEVMNGKEVIRFLQNQSVDIVVLDIAMPDMDGYETTLEIKKNFPQTKVCILSFHKEEKYIIRMYRAGISGYIIKDNGIVELVAAIREIAKGEEYFDKDVTRIALKALRGPAQTLEIEVKLTKREEEVLDLIADGLSAKEMSEILFIAESTVETHRKNLLDKLSIPNSKQLMKYAIEKGYGKRPYNN